MTLLTWNHGCTVGVRALDDQHGILMDTLNELRLALVRGQGHEQVSEILERLIALTRMHFVSEERLLEHYGYPDLEAHRAEHERLLVGLRESALRSQHAEAVALRPLLRFLRSWYEDHIEGADQQYGRWLNERGVF